MTRLSSRRIFLEFYVASVAEYGPEAIIKIMIPSEHYFESRIGDSTCCPWSSFVPFQNSQVVLISGLGPAWVYGIIAWKYFWQPPASIRPVTTFLCPDAQQKNIAPSIVGLLLTRPSIRNRPAALEVCCNLSEIECKIAEDDDIGRRSRRALLAPPRPVEPIT